MNYHPEAEYLRPNAAAEYLQMKYGHGAATTLARLRCHGGGPTFHKSGGVVTYTREALDAWARAKLSRPLHSTADLAAA